MLTQQDNATTETENRKDNNVSTQQDIVGHRRTQKDTVGHVRTQRDTLNKAPMSAEEKLLRAIFGDDDSEVKDTKCSNGKDTENKEPRTAPGFCIRRMADILVTLDSAAGALFLAEKAKDLPAKSIKKFYTDIVEEKADKAEGDKKLFLKAVEELKRIKYGEARPEGTHIVDLLSGDFTYTPVISWPYDKDPNENYCEDFLPQNLEYKTEEEAREDALSFIKDKPECKLEYVRAVPTYAGYILVENATNLPVTANISENYYKILAEQMIEERCFDVLDYLAAKGAVDKDWLNIRYGRDRELKRVKRSLLTSSLFTGTFPVPDEIKEKAERIHSHLLEYVSDSKNKVYGPDNDWVKDFELLNGENDMVVGTGSWFYPEINPEKIFYIPFYAVWRDATAKKDYRYVAILVCNEKDKMHFTVKDVYTDLWHLRHLCIPGSRKCTFAAVMDKDNYTGEENDLFMNEVDVCVYGEDIRI